MNVKPIMKRIPGSLATAIALILVVFSACSKPQTEKIEPSALAQDPILQERLEKDRGFKSSDSSPILEQDRPTFQGLAYYPINPDLKFSAKLNRYPGPKQVRLSTNTGEIRSGLRYGYFDFQIEKQTCRLQVYRLEDSSESGAYLFIPFRDSTSGYETYAAGRYLEMKENTTGIYDLDFNRAFNPYCAYNSKYSCPIPPSENTLQAPIRAGEKKYISSHIK